MPTEQASDYSAYDFPSYWEVLQQRADGKDPILSAGFGAGHSAGNAYRQKSVEDAIGDQNCKVFSAAFDLCKQLNLDVDQCLIGVVKATNIGDEHHVANIVALGQIAITQPDNPDINAFKEHVEKMADSQTTIENISQYLKARSLQELRQASPRDPVVASAPCRLMGFSQAAAKTHSEEKPEPSFSPGPR